MYLEEDVVPVEIVLLVALIGTARHVIDLDFTHMEPFKLVGVGFLIISLAGGYYLIKIVFRNEEKDKNPNIQKNSS